MKINLECSTDIRNGYINVTSWPLQNLPKDLPENTNVVVGNPANLDPIFKDGTAEEIVFAPLLNVLRPNDILPVLDHWRKKLDVGGSLKVSFIDIRLLAPMIRSGELNLEDIHSIVFGPNKQNESFMDCDVFKAIITSMGFKVASVSHNEFLVNVEAIKA